MRITKEHIGAVIRYRWRGQLFIVEGIEREGDGVFVYGTGSGGIRPRFPKHKDKQYYLVNGVDADNFTIVTMPNEFGFSRFTNLEEDIEVLIKEVDEYISGRLYETRAKAK